MRIVATTQGGWAAGPEQLQLPGRVGHLVLDLLIAAVALHHNAEPVSFNADFEAIALVSALRLTRGFGKGRWTAGDRLSRVERCLPAAAFIMQVLALAEQKAIDVRFDDHERFVNEVMTIDPVPYLKVVAVLHRES